MASYARRLAQAAPGGVRPVLRAFDPMARRRDRAAAALRRGDYAAAAERFLSLTRDGPEVAHHWLGYGQALMLRGEDARALEALARAHALRPDLLDPMLGAADLARRTGRDDLAEAMEVEALALLQSVEGCEAHQKTLLRHASDRAERAKAWPEVLRVRRRLAELEPDEVEHRSKVLAATVHGGDLRAAQRYAYAEVRAGQDLVLLHQLMEAWRATGRDRRAQLLCRVLTRRWPHSEPHRLIYAELVAARSGLGAGDGALRRSLELSGLTETVARAYYRIAFAAKDVTAAEARLRNFLRTRPDDLEAGTALAYAEATTRGLDAGERRLERLTLRSLQDAAPLKALAHLAMRRRDRPLTWRRWRRFREVYPADAGAAVEVSRALYEQGDAPAALAACRDWRLCNTRDLQMEQFYGRLLADTGDFHEAETTAATCLERFGSTWIAFETLVLARGHLGRLRGFDAELARLTPPVATYDDLKRGYQTVRIAEHFGVADGALHAVLVRAAPDLDLAWAGPYIERDRPERRNGSALKRALSRARADHARLVTRVDGDLAQGWSETATDTVDALLGRAATERPAVHIVNMFEQPNGGSELHALDLGERLKGYAEVSFWSPEGAHPDLVADHDVRSLSATAEPAPRGGVWVFVGVYYDLGPWLKRVGPRRVLALYNTFDAVKLEAFVREVRRHTGRRLELLFCADLMREEVGLPGLFEPSPIDLEHYAWEPRRFDAGRFVIGRHSRDVVEKHDVRDGVVYRALIERGAEVELLGATCMRALYPADSRLRLLPVRRGGVRQYLAGLDAFYYRTGTWIEPWGRVVIEAMATGLPVVVHERGGYAQAITPGVDGFVFRTDEEAIEQLDRLRTDPALRERMGRAARANVETLLGSQALRKLLAFYLA